MKGMLTLLAGIALLAAPAAQAQEQTTPFRPTSDWTADYGDDYCRLIRTFSDGEREISLALERIQPGPMVRLIMVGEGVHPFRGADRVGYAFGPAGASGGLSYARSITVDGRPFISFDPIVLVPRTAAALYDRAGEQAAAQGISGLTLDEGLRAPVRLDTGPLGAPIAALQACADSLLPLWGLDAAKYRAMSAPPSMIPNREGVLPQSSLPFRQMFRLRNFGGGTNQVQLLVAADGSVADCAIYASSVSRSVNERICRLARERASFVPAKDADGQPMASLWTGSLWDLGPPPSHAGRSAAAADWPTGRLGLTPPPSDAPPVALAVPQDAFPSPR